MKVLFDHQIFLWQKFGGISRYFVELMTRLPEDVLVSNSLLFTKNEYLKDSERDLNKGINLKIPEFRGKIRVLSKFEKLNSIYNLKKGDYDIFHPTYYDSYFLSNIKRPFVITVHDLIHEKFSYLSADKKLLDCKKKLISKANKIIAISNCTKNDLIEIYKVPEEKVEVIYHGSNLTSNNELPTINLPENYILFTGQRAGYKNFDNFAKAFAIIHKKYPEINLICTGSRLNPSELELLKSLGILDVTNSYYVSDSELTALYKHALCFVYPSLYEGFGIPILEAFNAGCPLALSEASCFPEIAKDAGLYFNPNDIESIANAIEQVIVDCNLRDELTTKGFMRIKSFSWNKMAKETYNMYKSLV